jgi:drug/metabolite transporter (DMT)-like permease
MQSSSNLRGIACMVLSGIMFVSCDSFLKLMLAQVPPFQSLVLRGIFATVCCFGLVVALGHVKQLPKAFSFWTLMRSLAEVIAVSSFIIALANMPLADLTAIYQVAPLIVLVGASLIWGEWVGRLRWLLIGLGLLGALLVAQPGLEGASPFAMLGFVTAFGSALRDILSRKAPADVPGPVVTFGVVVVVMLAGAINNLLFESWVPVSPEVWAYGLGAGFFVMLGHLFVFLAFRHASAQAVAPFYYSFTLVAGLFGFALFGEVPNSLALAGMVLIVACGLGVLYYERFGVKT